MTNPDFAVRSVPQNRNVVVEEQCVTDIVAGHYPKRKVQIGRRA